MANLLVVEDEQSVRHMLVRRLRQWGHEVAAMGSAIEAVDRMSISPAAIVFCDVIMPIRDGLWLLERMLHQALSRALAVIERRSQKLDDREHAVAHAWETCVNPQERQLGRQLRTAFERNRENIFLGCAKTQHSLYS